MIHYDVTKSSLAGHASGLLRVNTRLLAELGPAARPGTWLEAARAAGPEDWFLTGELFSESERPGFGEFLAVRRCRAAAIFHDAIPLRFPRITWPHSVARHPGYMKMLSRFDRVFAISSSSREELLGYWRWIGVEKAPPVDVLRLGADFIPGRRGQVVHCTQPDAAGYNVQPDPLLLCVGILEPRKNQSFLIGVCESLWAEGLRFSLELVGRVNPVCGREVADRVADAARRHPGLRYRGPVDDAGMARLYAAAAAGLFPTLAEGCGLPLLESLWMGVPVVCSDLPVLLENASGGGCVAVEAGNAGAWKSALRDFLTNAALRARLGEEARARRLPTWAEAAAALRTAMEERRC
jgi:glycosyltransferase involved in cell wall biosynthesis